MKLRRWIKLAVLVACCAPAFALATNGWGVRVGWMGRLTDTVSLGAAYSPKM